MADVIILGHGGFVKGDKEILVGRGQSVTFYSDAGQPLLLPGKLAASPGAGENGGDYDFDYEKVKKAFDLGVVKGEEVFSGGVTYNMSLGKVTDASKAIAQNLDWDGTLVMSDGPLLKLCTGDENSCPTPSMRAEQQKFVESQGTEGHDYEKDEDWEHSCDGILGQYKTSDIYWVSCTSFAFDAASLPPMPPEYTTGAKGPGA